MQRYQALTEVLALSAVRVLSGADFGIRAVRIGRTTMSARGRHILQPKDVCDSAVARQGALGRPSTGRIRRAAVCAAMCRGPTYPSMLQSIRECQHLR